MARILVFGDSIAWGAYDSELGGWVNRLRLYLDKKFLEDESYDYSIYNFGVSGDTSDEIVRRFEFETKCTTFKDEEIIVLFAFGVNDPSFIESLTKPKVTEEKFLENLELLLGQAKKYASKIMFVGPAPVYEPETLPWYDGTSYSNTKTRQYDKIIEKFCEEKNVHYLGLFEKFEKSKLKSHTHDGLHPNSKGHKLIFQEVKKALVKNKFI